LLSLIQRHLSARSVLRNTVRIHTSTPTNESKNNKELKLRQKLIEAANEARRLIIQGNVPKVTEIRLLNDPESFFTNSDSGVNDTKKLINCQYSINACFSGFVVSVIDSVPSEIAVISLKRLNFMAAWDRGRVADATTAISIGWLQIDNHCPNAAFPVALSPKLSPNGEEFDGDDSPEERAFLGIGVVFAPSHKSNIMVSILFRSVRVTTSFSQDPNFSSYSYLFL
jgi:hypothetical protein